MRQLYRLALVAGTALAMTSVGAQVPKFSDGVIRIGVLNDRAGPYADLSGEGSAIAARMAAADRKSVV